MILPHSPALYPKRVFIAGGVTITDCDFHPMAAAGRMLDTMAISPAGDRRRRPKIVANPVTIEDDVWIGCNATVLKGLRIGAGAVIAPGSVVTRDVEPNTVASGNPLWHDAGVQIGRGSVVGCKTIITQDVPSYSVMVGNPARLLFRLEPDDTPEMRRAALEEFGLAPLVAHDSGREHTN